MKAISDVLVPMGRLRDSVTRTIDRLREYRSALITAAVTGQLDLRSTKRRWRRWRDCRQREGVRGVDRGAAWYERVVNKRLYQFEWDEAKAAANERKHDVTLELASSVFYDPHLLTIADAEHSETEERWFSIGIGRNGAVLPVVYLWPEADPAVIKIRPISARKATQAELRQYEEGL